MKLTEVDGTAPRATEAGGRVDALQPRPLREVNGLEVEHTARRPSELREARARLVSAADAVATINKKQIYIQY